MEAEKEKLISRVDVLDKTKGLLLLPQMEMATTKQVAEFYKVSVEVIRQLVMVNFEEVSSDGYVVYTSKDIKGLYSENNSLYKTVSKRGYFLIESEDGYIKMGNAKSGLFPKRAILRVGMLLKGCYVTYSEVYTGTSCPCKS